MMAIGAAGLMKRTVLSISRKAIALSLLHAEAITTIDKEKALEKAMPEIKCFFNCKKTHRDAFLTRHEAFQICQCLCFASVLPLNFHAAKEP